MRQILKSRVVGIVAGTLVLGGFVGMVLRLLTRVRQGRGIDHYTAMSGLEWSALPVLVLLVLAIAILVIGGVLRWYFEHREEGHFIATLRQRMQSRRAKRIRSVFQSSRRTYGSPRVQRALASQGVHVSRRRVERLMRAAGLRAWQAHIYRPNRKLHVHYAQHPNLLWQTQARRVDGIWVGDVTYVRVAKAWRFLATVMDQYSRRVLGWSLARVRSTRLTRAALDHAIRRRRAKPGLIFHSDRGSEYLGAGLSERLVALGVRQSTTRGGSPADNAHAESFFHSMKADTIHGVVFANEAQLRRCISSYVQYYNHQRLHSSLGYRSPVAYEELAA